MAHDDGPLSDMACTSSAEAGDYHRLQRSASYSGAETDNNSHLDRSVSETFDPEDLDDEGHTDDSH